MTLARGLARHAVLVAGGIVMLVPFAWMVLTSLKGMDQILAAPLSLFPDPVHFDNYPASLQAAPFATAYLNSAYIAVVVVSVTLLTSSMAGYAFARLSFRGSDLVFLAFLAMMMVPRQVTIIPLYLLMSKIGWIDSHLAIIVPAALFNPFAVFLVRQFVRSVPIELEEAAIMDGASRWTIYRGVVLPLIRPGLAALGIIVFLDSWNNFFYPLIFLNSPERYTVPLLLSLFQGAHTVDYSLLMAGTVLSVLPLIAVYVIGQRLIIDSVAFSGLSGR